MALPWPAANGGINCTGRLWDQCPPSKTGPAGVCVSLAHQGQHGKSPLRTFLPLCETSKSKCSTWKEPANSFALRGNSCEWSWSVISASAYLQCFTFTAKLTISLFRGLLSSIYTATNSSLDHVDVLLQREQREILTHFSSSKNAKTFWEKWSIRKSI